MNRVSSVPYENIPDYLQNIMREYDVELGGSEFVQVLAHAPETFKSFIDYYFGLVTENKGKVDMVITELVRLMVARKNDCFLWLHARFAVAKQEGLTEEKISEIGNYQQSQAFSKAEKAAIRYADILAGEHESASKNLFDELRLYFTESEIIELGMRISTFLGYGRLIHVLGLEIGKTCPIRG